MWHIYLARGNVYMKIGEYDKAITDFSIVIQNNPKSSRAFLERGRAFAMAGSLKAARQDFQKSAALNPSQKDRIEKIIEEFRLNE
jgi:tetratricopeptide (TPR) repeat protein